jgi:hypothetical protein
MDADGMLTAMRRIGDDAAGFVALPQLLADAGDNATQPLPADSELTQAITALTRAQQHAGWDRTRAHHKLRSLLREYYPAMLAAFATHSILHHCLTTNTPYNKYTTAPPP